MVLFLVHLHWALVTMAIGLHGLVKEFEEELLMNHRSLIRKLEVKYVDHVNKLMMQKQAILNNLQMQYNERRKYIKQMLIGYKTKECAKRQSSRRSVSDQMKYLMNDLEAEKEAESIKITNPF